MDTLSERLNICNQNIAEGKEAIVSSFQSIGFTEASTNNTFTELAAFIKQCRLVDKKD